MFRLRPHADDAPALFNQADGLGVHQQLECRKALGPRDEEIQEVPLRHHGDEFAARRQMRKVGAGDLFVVELDLHPPQFLMRQPQELVEHPQLMHQLQRGRMDGVAAKVAEEVPVLFEHDHLNSGAGQQQPEHHSGGATADNATSGSGLSCILLGLTHKLLLVTRVHRTGLSGLQNGSAAAMNSIGTSLINSCSHSAQYFIPACSDTTWPSAISPFFLPDAIVSCAYSTNSHSRVSPTTRTSTSGCAKNGIPGVRLA